MLDALTQGDDNDRFDFGLDVIMLGMQAYAERMRATARPDMAVKLPPPGPGARNALTDVPGLRVGHATRIGGGALTGATVVLGPPGGMVAAVDARRRGPGHPGDRCASTRATSSPASRRSPSPAAAPTDSTRPRASWPGWPTRAAASRSAPDPHEVVPVVPAATIFDLGRGGDFRQRPDRRPRPRSRRGRGRTPEHAPVRTGVVGAGAGAFGRRAQGRCGHWPVACSTAASPWPRSRWSTRPGPPLDPTTGLPYAAALGLPGEFPLVPPSHDEHAAALAQFAEADPPLNTTLAVVATDAVLTRAQAHKTAGAAHDGTRAGRCGRCARCRRGHRLRPVDRRASPPPVDAETSYAVSTRKPPRSRPSTPPRGRRRPAPSWTRFWWRNLTDMVLGGTRVTVPSYRALYPHATARYRPRG
ncbi:P1 family peptidase [Yinghuangia aomiensis]